MDGWLDGWEEIRTEGRMEGRKEGGKDDRKYFRFSLSLTHTLSLPSFFFLRSLLSLLSILLAAGATTPGTGTAAGATTPGTATARGGAATTAGLHHGCHRMDGWMGGSVDRCTDG